MFRTFLILAVTLLTVPALAADVLPSAAVRQSFVQLRSDVAALRSVAAKGGDVRAVIAASLPGLKDRARAAKIEAEAFERYLKERRKDASILTVRAQTEYAVSQIEGMVIPSVGDAQRDLAAMKEALSALELAIDRLLTELNRLANEEQQELDRLKAHCTKACQLPHANLTCANGQCAIAYCHAGWVDNDGKPANGCEASARAQ